MIGYKSGFTIPRQIKFDERWHLRGIRKIRTIVRVRPKHTIKKHFHSYSFLCDHTQMNRSAVIKSFKNKQTSKKTNKNKLSGPVQKRFISILRS